MNVILLLFGFVVQVLTLTEDWETFKVNYGKRYTNIKEELERRKIFHENKQIIEDHNKKFLQGFVPYSMAINNFADLTHSEFRLFKGNLVIDNSTSSEWNFLPMNDKQLPSSFDWRDKGAVTDVKKQGSCGACWAFSSTGSLEGQHFLSTGQLVPLSEQQLIDCSGTYGNTGCQGGIMNQAFIYINANGGIEKESSYPYEAKDSSCRFQSAEVASTLKGIMKIPSGNESALMVAVATAGPVSVAIDTTHKNFQFYSEGIYYESSCKTTDPDHALLVVGYGMESDQDYWLAKNSWGKEWGEKGYIRMSRNKDNNCGIASYASYPVV